MPSIVAVASGIVADDPNDVEKWLQQMGDHLASAVAFIGHLTPEQVTAVASVAVAIFTAVLAIATVRLWNSTAQLAQFAEQQGRDMQASIEQARRVADLTERNLSATQRAFVHLKALDVTVVGKRIAPTQYKIVPLWENSGTTPTRNLSININWTPYSGGNLPDGFGYEYGTDPTRLFLGPKAESNYGSFDIPISEIRQAKAKTARIFVWGRADYSDIIEGTRQHFTEFCFRLDIKEGGGPDGQDWLAFTHWGPHNRSDEDT